MPQCVLCEEEVVLPFKCNYCGELFCAKHRLPETHDCPYLPKEAPAHLRKEEMERLPNSRGKQIIGILIIVGLIVAAFVFLYKPQLLQGPPSYALGEEVRGYPIDELASSITYWKTTKKSSELGVAGWPYSDAENGTSLVAFNITVRNIANTELNFFSNEVYLRLYVIEPPKLKYGNYYADAERAPAGHWADICFDGPNSLMPNQTTKGLLLYKILDGYQPTVLVYPNENSPNFIIAVS